jgi:hypothetical protein
MSQLNTGDIMSLYQGSRMLVGTDEVVNIVSGTMRVLEPGPELHQHWFRGNFQGAYEDRSADRHGVELSVHVTLNVARAARSILKPAQTSNKVATVPSIVIEAPEYKNATSGMTMTMSNAFVSGDMNWEENREQYDRIPITLMHDANAPVYGTFGP